MAPGASTPTAGSDVDALALWDDNGNGRITCAEARAHSIAPVRRRHPAYPPPTCSSGSRATGVRLSSHSGGENLPPL